MNQTIHNKEYDMAMLCAMALLGLHPGKGFRDPESYPQILSAIIKVGRFMMAQQAEEIARPDEGSESHFSPSGSPCNFDDDDSGYGSVESQLIVSADRYYNFPSSIFRHCSHL